MDARNRIIRAFMPLGLTATSLFIAGPALAASPPTCAGQIATIVGTSGDDVLVGTSRSDIIVGLGGDDEIHGLGGADIICGNNGSDVIHGGNGDDRLFGGNAMDVLYGDAGADELTGNSGKDTLRGGSHDDVLLGGMHADRLFGEGGNDLLVGGHAADMLRGGAHSDTLYGGGDDDNLRGGAGTDIIVGDGGFDVASGGADFDRCEADEMIECEDDLNDAPHAADDHFLANETELLVGNLFDDNGAGRDDDPNADPIKVTAVDGAPVDHTLEIALASGAVVTVYEDGSFSYQASARHEGMGEGSAVADGFAYTVADPKGKTDDAAVAVTVGGANDAPVANDDEDGTDEDVSVDIDVLANDTDPEENDLVVVAVDTSNIEGTVAINEDNTVRYTPAVAFGALSAGDEVEEEFFYTVDDGFGGTAVAKVTVFVEGVNDAPAAADDAAATDEDTPVEINVLSNDSDPDAYGELTVTLATAPAHGTVAKTGPGTFRYTPDTDWNGVDAFTYQVDDNTGNQAEATVTVTVGAVNDAPVAVDDAAAANGGSMIIIVVLANDTDVDGDALDVTVTSGPDHGTVVLLSNGSLAYTAPEGYSGIDVLTYQVSDAANVIDTATVTV
ncbi:MAG: Ig-like domain-containing protein, partial [Acidimicrobiia bacterium]|nr:Ig-like domain-containing protein [Acidimicrobiia bacterium]